MKRTGEENRIVNEKNVRKSLNRTTLTFVILLVLGIIGIIFVVLFVNKATSLVLEEDTYQYYCTTQVFHNTGVSLTNSEMSTILINDKEKEGVDNTPMYSRDNMSIYLPESYSYCSSDDGSFWRIPEFMKLTRASNNVIECSFNDDYYEIKHGFLFDGGLNYIFLDSGEIYVGGISKYRVSVFSFFSMEYSMYRVYDTATNSFYPFDRDKTSDIKFVSDRGYSIDLFKGSYTNERGEEQLLIASPSLLHSIDER